MMKKRVLLTAAAVILTAVLIGPVSLAYAYPDGKAPLMGEGEPGPASEPSPEPTGEPTPAPDPSPEPTAEPTPDPTAEPTPTPDPTAEPTPTPEPTAEPTPTPEPTGDPTPTPEPTGEPTPTPTVDPTGEPTPSPDPTGEPTPSPEPSADPAVSFYAKTSQKKVSIYLVTVSQAPEDGSTWTYDGDPMYKAGTAWLWLTTAESESEALSEAEEAVTAVSVAETELTRGTDINLSGKTDINDCQLIRNLYEGKYEDLEMIGRDKALMCDTDGNGRVTIEDTEPVIKAIFDQKS